MKKKISIDGAQNVEVSKPIPCEKSPQEQLAIMEAYTQAHRDSAALDKAERELRCLRTIFPALFRSIEMMICWPDVWIFCRLALAV